MSKTKSDQKRDAALAALLTCETLTEAAEQAGISRRTLYSYIHDDVDFARAYDAARNHQMTTFADTLHEKRMKAATIIADLMEDPEQPAAIRLRAAQTFINASAAQEKATGEIAAANIEANRDMLDFSRR